MDRTPRTRNSTAEPPALSEDHDRENSKERGRHWDEEMERLRREELEKMLRHLKPMEKFIQLFEEEKRVIEGHLRELGGIADKLDEAHRKATIFKTAGSSASAAGGVMIIAALALVPFIFGASAVLAVAGLGAGVAGGAFNIATEVEKASSDGGDNKRVEAIAGIIQSKISVLGESVNDACRAVSQIDAQHVLIKLAAVGVCVGVGDILVDSAALLLSKGSRVLGGALAGTFLIWDLYHITNNSIDIYNGCKSERAKEIRELVKKVQKDLAKLTGISANMRNVLGKL